MGKSSSLDQLEAKIGGEWKRVRILTRHLPAGKRGLSYSVQDIETEKAYLVEAVETRTVLNEKSST